MEFRRLKGDVDFQDGEVTIFDAALLGSNFGTSSSYPWDGKYNFDTDCNEDGKVDILDATILGSSYGDKDSHYLLHRDPNLWHRAAGVPESESWFGGAWTWGKTPTFYTNSFVWWDASVRGCWGHVEIEGEDAWGCMGIGQGRYPWGSIGYAFPEKAMYPWNHELRVRYKYNVIDAGWWSGIGINIWGKWSPYLITCGTHIKDWEAFVYLHLGGSWADLIPWDYTICRQWNDTVWQLWVHKRNTLVSQNVWIEQTIDLTGLIKTIQESDPTKKWYITGIFFIGELLYGDIEIWLDRCYYYVPHFG